MADVAYSELVASPIVTVERLYEHLGWPVSVKARAAMQDYLTANPKDAHGTHRYTLQAFGLDRRQERQRFARYCERFAIRREGKTESPATVVKQAGR